MNTLLQEYHARLGAALASRNRLAAIEQLHAEMEARIAALEPMAQPAMFPAGEDAPLFTLPEDAPADLCSKCNRHPAESGRANWERCETCGAAMCDTCRVEAYNGIYCSERCADDAAPF